MLDSIREICHGLNLVLQTNRTCANSVIFEYEQTHSYHELLRMINEGKCPVVQCSPRLYKQSNCDALVSEHVMVATGIKVSTDGKKYIQLKNSYQENPSEQGIIQNVSV